MEIIAIGDVHGRSIWKRVVHNRSFDKLVIIGDYFDSREDIPAQEQIRNFQELIAYKEAYPDHVILLTGNHDFHYLPAARAVDETYSGYQEQYAYQISFVLQAHLHHLQMSYLWNNYLFTHAGVTNTWLESVGYKEEAIDTFINDLFRQKPVSFLFNGWDPKGDDVTQSPIWVRPYSLRKDAYDYEHVKQVVGHTQVRKVQIVDERFYFIDTMGGSREYLISNEDGFYIDKAS